MNSSEVDFTESYWSTERKSLIEEKKIKVRRASEALEEVILEFEINREVMKIIKIDIEGAEYKVLSELDKSGLLTSFDIIFGECHLGIEGIMEICKFKFTLIYLKPEFIQGCYNFLLVRNKKFEVK